MASVSQTRFDEVRAAGKLRYLRTREVEMPNPSIKDERLYQELRKQGDSQEKAARIFNAAANRGRSNVAKSGGKSGSKDWTVPELKRCVESRKPRLARGRAELAGHTEDNLHNKNAKVTKTEGFLQKETNRHTWRCA